MILRDYHFLREKKHVWKRQVPKDFINFINGIFYRNGALLSIQRFWKSAWENNAEKLRNLTFPTFVCCVHDSIVSGPQCILCTYPLSLHPPGVFRTSGRPILVVSDAGVSLSFGRSLLVVGGVGFRTAAAATTRATTTATTPDAGPAAAATAAKHVETTRGRPDERVVRGRAVGQGPSRRRVPFRLVAVGLRSRGYTVPEKVRRFFVSALRMNRNVVSARNIEVLSHVSVPVVTVSE